MLPTDLIQIDDNGIFVPAGNFYIDPCRKVDRAVITHAHSDHARPGCGSYLTSQRGLHVLRQRLGPNAAIQTLSWNQALKIADVTLSFHPAGHILGSAQVRLQYKGRVTVVSGDYKTQPDPTCDGFEPVKCDTFVTESTFALPVYRWRPVHETFDQINRWWRANAASNMTSVIYGYSLGKAQRLLAGVDGSIGPIAVHASIASMNEAYLGSGVNLPRCLTGAAGLDTVAGKGLYVTPASVRDDGWAARLGPTSTAAASGWMLLKAARKKQSIDHGFVLSDHADWPGILDAIRQTSASRVLVTHGHVGTLVRWLVEQGLDAAALGSPVRRTGHAPIDEPGVSNGDEMDPHFAVDEG
jgi:putative mRNA 3-end processing factor